jgi:hypothetical protein
LCAFALSLVPSFASADEPSVAEWAQHRVEDGLVKPLAEAESHRMTRARPPPRERRVRVTQTTTTLDKSGRPFVSFAVDVRFGGAEWHENDIVGCAYTGSGTLYVKRGDEYRPASFLLGKNEGPVTGVCEAPARS